MTSSDSQTFDDQRLTRYLLGFLPESEAEQLDELSVADQEFAWRLEAVENDLVDAYVRGELPAEDREQFRKRYLSSPRRREKVNFAGGLLALEQRTPALPEKHSTKASATREKSAPGFLSRLFSVPQRGLQWGFASAACVLLFVTGFLFFQNLRLSREIHKTQEQYAALTQKKIDLERQFGDQKAENAQAVNARPPASSVQLDHLTTVALFLAPPTRGASQLPTLTVPPGTQLVVLSLGVETGEFASYKATLKDLATNQLVWRGVAHPSSSGGKKTVTVSFPSSLLKQQSYLVELAGQADGRSQIVGSYPFRVAIK